MVKSVLLTLLAVGWSFCCLSQATPKAKRGVIDLSNVEFTNHEIILLEGQWEFYWQHLLTPEDPVRELIPKIKYLNIPNVWSFYQLPSKGYGTYRLRLLLDEDVHSLSMLIPNVYSAYKLYVNGELRAENGETGNEKAHTTPDWKEQLIYLEGLNKEVELLWQVANFHHSRGGAHKPILTGSFDDILKHRELITFGNTFFLGGLVIMAACFLTFFVFRPDMKQYLYFSCFCFFWAIRVAFAHNYLINDLFHDMTWSISLRIEYLSLYISFLMGMLFIHHVFQYNKGLFTAILTIINFIFVTTALVLPTDIFTLLLNGFFTFAGLSLLNALYVIARALYEKQPEAWFSATGIGVGIIIFFMEFFAYNHSTPINLIYLNIAYLLVFFVNGLVLIYGFVKAYHQVDKLESEKSALYSMQRR